MKNTYHNTCVRCGKERIVARTWTEKVGYSVVVNREMICPDPECQKLVVEENNKQVARFKNMKEESEKRKKIRYASAQKKRMENNSNARPTAG